MSPVVARETAISAEPLPRIHKKGLKAAEKAISRPAGPEDAPVFAALTASLSNVLIQIEHSSSVCSRIRGSLHNLNHEPLADAKILVAAVIGLRAILTPPQPYSVWSEESRGFTTMAPSGLPCYESESFTLSLGTRCASEFLPVCEG